MLLEMAELQKEFFEKIQVGDRIEGTVKSIMVFGAFVDIGGVDGLPVTSSVILSVALVLPSVPPSKNEPAETVHLSTA